MSCGKVALVHDWLTGMRGGERCLEVFCEMFPRADLYTLIYRGARMAPAIAAMNVRASWINRLPAVESYYRYCLPLFPNAIEKFELKDYDLVISSSHCVAKGAIAQNALHIAYIHSPMRYIWDLHDVYFGTDSSWLSRTGMSVWRDYLQQWDLRSSQRVDFFIANSRNVAAKISKLYGRQAAVIYPPVDIERFYVRETREPYYLLVSALVPYKRTDIAIAAFNRLKLPLKIVGSGPLRKRLAKMAKPNIEFLGWVDDLCLAHLYASCQAVIFPGEEDFGIVPVEAQASGRPVIAYGKGGALESVLPWNFAAADSPSGPNPTGIFFDECSVESLMEAVRLFQKNHQKFAPVEIRRHASKFSRQRFAAEFRDYVKARMGERQLET